MRATFLRIIPVALLSLPSKPTLKRYYPLLHCEPPIHQPPLLISSTAVKTTKTSTQIWRHLKPHWILLSTIITLSGLSAIVNIAIPIFIGQLVTAIQTSRLISLNIPALKLLALFFTQSIITTIDISLVSRLGEMLSKSLKIELYTAFLKQDIAFFDGKMQGELISRLSQDVSEFKHTFKQCMSQGLKCAAQIIGTAFHLIHISSSLTITLLTTTPFMYIGMSFYGSFLRSLSVTARNGDADCMGSAGEALSNIRTVRAFAAEEYEIDKFTNQCTDSASKNVSLGTHIGLFQGLTNSAIGCMVLTILYKGGALVAQGDLTGGELMTFMVATQSAQRSLSIMGGLFGKVVKAISSADRIFEYINLQPSITPQGGISLPRLKGSVKFNQVEFSYPARPDLKVLSQFNLELPQGKIIAICGDSGAGKSTIAQLIERFYEPDSGFISIDGVPLQYLDLNWLRKKIGFMNQEPSLFATSIFENIRYGNQHATLDQVKDAAAQANAADFIESFPDSYNTIIGERGITLSGGQKQRIAIARAILLNPQILILDEATSALDHTSESLVQDALDTLMKGKTVLIIAHRLSTIRNADLIVVMKGLEKGSPHSTNIIEQGTHAELMWNRGAYYNLYRDIESKI